MGLASCLRVSYSFSFRSGCRNVINRGSVQRSGCLAFTDVSKIQVSTYRLQGVNAGNPFIACNHCSGILKGFDILTGY